MKFRGIIGNSLLSAFLFAFAWAQWEARGFLEVNSFRRGMSGFIRTTFDIFPYHLAFGLIFGVICAVIIKVVVSIFHPRSNEGVKWACWGLPPLAFFFTLLFCRLHEIFSPFLAFALGLLTVLVALAVFLVRNIDFSFRARYAILVFVLLCANTWINLPVPPNYHVSASPPVKVYNTNMKVLLFALDGATWIFAADAVRDGRMPIFERLMKNGAYGMLHTYAPALSPVVWTTIATGKKPEKHGIEGWVVFRLKLTGAPFLNFPKNHFLSLINGNNKMRLVKMTPLGSTYRRVRAIWNVLNARNDKVVQVGWWATWPAEKVNGIMVTPYAWPFVDTVMLQENLPMAHPPGSTYPSSMMEHLKPFVVTTEDLKNEEFMGIPLEVRRKLEPQADVYDLWYYAKDISFVKMFDKLLEEHPNFSFATVYLEGTDIVQHVFLRYAKPEWFRGSQCPSDEEIHFLGHVIENYYSWVDSQIGVLLRHADENTIIGIISDHGIEPSWRNMHYSGDHVHAPPGIFIFAGGPIKKGVVFNGARIEDIAPTLLYLMGYPVGDDMDGRVLTEIIMPDFWEKYPIKKVGTLDGGFIFGQRHDESIYDENLIDKLKAVGYL